MPTISNGPVVPENTTASLQPLLQPLPPLQRLFQKDDSIKQSDTSTAPSTSMEEDVEDVEDHDNDSFCMANNICTANKIEDIVLERSRKYNRTTTTPSSSSSSFSSMDGDSFFTANNDSVDNGPPSSRVDNADEHDYDYFCHHSNPLPHSITIALALGDDQQARPIAALDGILTCPKAVTATTTTGMADATTTITTTSTTATTSSDESNTHTENEDYNEGITTNTEFEDKIDDNEELLIWCSSYHSQISNTSTSTIIVLPSPQRVPPPMQETPKRYDLAPPGATTTATTAAIPLAVTTHAQKAIIKSFGMNHEATSRTRDEPDHHVQTKKENAEDVIALQRQQHEQRQDELCLALEAVQYKEMVARQLAQDLVEARRHIRQVQDTAEKLKRDLEMEQQRHEATNLLVQTLVTARWVRHILPCHRARC
jgi:hypothetical protein